MSIYIRHAEKTYSNNDPYPYPFDSPITEESKERVERKTIELFNRFGLPRKIVVSPFLRARETADIIVRTLKEATSAYKIEIRIDRSIGEYLGNQRSKTKEGLIDLVRQETLDYSPFHNENFGRFRDRVHSHIRDVREQEGVYNWYITHGIFIKEILKHFNPGTFIEEISYLGSIEVKGGSAYIV